MGVASGLFFSTNGEVDTLHSHIVPSDEQTTYLQAKWNGLAAHLIDDLAERSGYRMRSWLQGSYKIATVIRPVSLFDEFDVDLGIYYCWDSDEQATPAAAQLKTWAHESLVAFAETADDVKEVEQPSRERCERIRFEKQFHIDIPAYHLNEEVDRRRLATSTKGWEPSDPKAFYVWFKDQAGNPERTQLRRVVRYLKAWAAMRFTSGQAGRPTSIQLTVLATEAFLEVGDEVKDDEDVFCAVVANIRDRLQQSSKVPNPVDTTENLSRQGDEELAIFLTAVDTLADTCARAKDCDDVGAAALIWDEVFGHLFPLPDSDASIEFEQQNGRALAVVPTLAVDVRDADGNYLATYQDEVPRVPKNCRLRFRITNPQVIPTWATIDWVVRNAGGEALAINDFGHSRRGARDLENEERTAYTGRHFMDCIVRHDGNAIAATRIPVYVAPPALAKQLPAKPWYRRHVKPRRR